MTHDKKETEALLDKLESHLEEDPSFTSSEIAVIREMVNAWRGWQALGRLAKWIIVTLGLIAAGVASWSALVANFKDWMKP